MTDRNEKVLDMSDKDATELIASFLTRQEKRDVDLRKELSQLTKDLSSAITAISGLSKDKESLFDLHNENVNERLKSSKEQWKTVLQGLGVAAIIMGAILAPLVSEIAGNSKSIDDNHTETRAMVHVLEGHVASVKTEAAILSERHAQEMRMLRAWIDEDGRIAFPSLQK